MIPTSRKVVFFRGYHSEDAIRLVRESWEKEETLIFCPPHLPEVSISGFLDEATEFPQPPVLGVYSSGTADPVPKLILYSKKNIEACVDGILSFFDTAKITDVFCYPQPFHVFGLNLGYVMAMLRGWKLHFSPGKYGKAAHDARAALTMPGLLTLGTPTHFQDLIKHCEGQGRELAPSYSAILGGAQVNRDLWIAVRDRLKIDAPSIGYGASEASPGVTHSVPGREPQEDGEVGFPLPQLDVRLNDQNRLVVSGPSVCLATLRDGQLAFPTSLTLTDSLRRRESDGTLVFTGRDELVLNRGGEKFSLAAIENCLREKLKIETLCVAVADARLGHELGILVTREQSQFIDDILPLLKISFGRDFCRRRLVVVDRFPMNENLKADRRAAAETIQTETKFPLNVKELEAWVPHRAPMVWIDEVLSAKPNEGECLVRVDRNAHYCDEGKIRPSSLIEWMAQGFGFVKASQLPPGYNKPKRAYMVGFRGVEYLGDYNAEAELVVHTKCSRELGPLAIIQGEIKTRAGQVLARANLKVYAE